MIVTFTFDMSLQVSSDVFEFKLLQLLDRFGTLSNAEAAKHAVALFKNHAKSDEHRSLALSVISISIPQQLIASSMEKNHASIISRPSTSTYIFYAFFVEAGGSELLARWLVDTVSEENIFLSKYISDTLKEAIDGLKGLSIKANSSSLQAQLTKVKRYVQEASQKKSVCIMER